MQNIIPYKLHRVYSTQSFGTKNTADYTPTYKRMKNRMTYDLCTSSYIQDIR